MTVGQIMVICGSCLVVAAGLAWLYLECILLHKRKRQILLELKHEYLLRKQEKSLKFCPAYYSDIGKKETNQDSLLLMQRRQPQGDEIVFAVICDGVGGLKGASKPAQKL